MSECVRVRLGISVHPCVCVSVHLFLCVVCVRLCIRVCMHVCVSGVGCQAKPTE